MSLPIPSSHPENNPLNLASAAPDRLKPRSLRRCRNRAKAGRRYHAEALERRLLLATIFSDGFEGTFPGDWSAGNDGGGTASSHWGTNRARSSAGTWSAFCADNGDDQRDTYDNSLSTFLERRNISLVNYGQPSLSFKYWLNTQTTLDPFVVRVKDQNGQWHEQFRDSGDDSGWGWQTKNIDLNSYAGQSGLTIQFRFDSDGSTVPDAPSGVWLDEVSLTGEPQTPDLRGYQFSVNSTAHWSQQFQVTAQVQNTDNGSSGAFTQKFYLSNDGTWGDADDVYLGSYAHASVGPNSLGSQFQAQLQMPSSPPSGYLSHGYYLLGMKTDADSAVTESDEMDNGPGVGNGQDYTYFNVAPAPDIDLTLYRVSDTAGSANSSNPGAAQSAFARGQTVRITLAGNNNATAAAVRATLRLRGPDNSTWVYDSHSAGQDNSTDSPLNTAETDYYSFDWSIPVDASLGQYDLTAAIRDLTSWDLLYDDTSPGRNNESNGEIVQDAFGVWQPDLVGTVCDAPASGSWGQTISVSGRVMNLGMGPAGNFTQQFYLSADGSWGDADDALVGTYVQAAIGPGAEGAAFNASLTLPTAPPNSEYLSHGTYRIGMKTDAANQIAESSELNNGPGLTQYWDWDTIVLSPSANIELTLYRISDTSGIANTASPGTALTHIARNQTVRITLSGNNTGASAPVKTMLKIRGPDNATWVYDSHVAGQDNSYDSPLSTSETDYYSFDWTVFAGANLGACDLMAEIHDYSQYSLLYDDTSPGRNNEGTGPILFDQFFISLPDLLGSQCIVPASGTWGQTISIQGQVRNIGQVPAGSFTQKFFLSADANWWNGDEYPLSGSYLHAPIAANTIGEAFNVSVTLPSAPPTSAYTTRGTFRIGMYTDANGNIEDANRNNNGPGSFGLEVDWDSIDMGTAANVDVNLYRVSDVTGTANSANPGTAITQFRPGQTVRITLVADNIGASAPVKAQLRLRAPDNSTWAWDSHGAGADNGADSPLASGETDYYSFDWLVPSNISPGLYDVQGAIRDANYWQMIYDTTQTGRNNDFGGDDTKLDRFTADGIIWINRGTSTNDSDWFEHTYTTDAATARSIIDRAIFDWNRIITSFNYSGGGNTYSVTVNAGPLSNLLGQASYPTLDADNKPTAGVVTMDDDANIPAGWYFDPVIGSATLPDDGEFTTLGGTWMARGAADTAGYDFYQTAVHEMGHLMGLLWDSTGTLRIMNYMTNTWIMDKNYNYLYTFNVNGGPIEATFTTNGGGHLFEGPAVSGHPEMPIHPHDCMNSGRALDYGGKQRLILSDIDATVLRDAYGYTIALPSTINSFYANLDTTTKDLTINGAPGVSDDNIRVDVDAVGRLRVQVNGTSELFPLDAVDLIIINAGDGNDVVDLASVPADIPIASQLGLGNDHCQVGEGNLAGQIIGAVTVSGGGGTDLLVLDDRQSTGADSYYVSASTFDKTGFSWLEYDGLEGLTLKTNNQHNDIVVTETFAGTPLTLDCGDGEDLVHVNMDDSGSAQVLFDSTQRLGGLDLHGGGRVTLNAGGDKVLVTLDLLMAPAAKLDLNDNAMIVDYAGASPGAATQALLATGFSGGSWTGSGIMSSVAAASPGAGIGLAEATHLFSSFPASFAGQSIDSTSLLLCYTLAGDATFDCKVSTRDFNLLAGNFGGSGKIFSQGDFNYSSGVDSVDFGILLSQYGKTLVPLAPVAATAATSLVPPLFGNFGIEDTRDPAGALLE